MSTSVFFSKLCCLSVFGKCLKDRNYNVYILPFCFSISYCLNDKTKTGFALYVFVRIFCKKTLEKHVLVTHQHTRG